MLSKAQMEIRKRENEKLYKLAWLIREVKATKSAGKNKQKYVYEKFDDFYKPAADEEKKEKEEKVSKLMEYKRRKAGG